MSFERLALSSRKIRHKDIDMEYAFTARLAVRDYECDIEGIVNNANYMHYAEHTRHLFLKSRGLSFAEMHRRGVDAVVARVNMRFKTPLRCDDEMLSRLNVRKEGLKYVFEQDIYRASDEKLCFHATTDVVCLVNGRLASSDEYDKALGPFADK